MLVTTAVVVAVGTGGRHSGRSGNPLVEREGVVDRLDVIDTAARFHTGKLSDLNVTSWQGKPAMMLADSADKSFRRGCWIGPVVETAFPFDELIPSYNAQVPKDTGVRLQVSVRDARSGEWSPWLYFGRWGRTISADADDRVILGFAGGKVSIDVLELSRAASAYRFRVVLQSFSPDPQVSPLVRRVSAVYSGVVGDATTRTKLAEVAAPSGEWSRDLPVPFRPQRDAPAPLRSEVCSPTSVTMVMAFAGVDRPLFENAAAIYDDEKSIFGNWNRAVQRAGELGLDAWVTRFRSWEPVRAAIAGGQPVIASIRFQKGVMPSNPLYQDTDGHLIVIRGFTRDGNVIVNDPASAEKGNGVVYPASELGAAWFGAGGVAYVIRAPSTTGNGEPSSPPTTRPNG